MKEQGSKWIVALTLLCILTILMPVSGFSAKDSYQLGALDILSVSIFAGGEKQVDVELTIGDDGMVNFPLLGSVRASGMSSTELEKAVAGPLEAHYYVDPQVYIRIKEYRSLHFSISGAVKKPGKYEMQTATKLMDLIAKAEGATKERGNIAYILRDTSHGSDPAKGAASGSEERERQEPLKVNLLKLLDEGDMRHNIDLLPGDAVYIPLATGLNQAEQKVYVAGHVEKPDLYEYQPGLTALSACIMAGGFAKYAAPNRTTIIRIENGEQQVIKIDLEDVIKGKIPDPPLQPGDRINVPESWF